MWLWTISLKRTLEFNPNFYKLYIRVYEVIGINSEICGQDIEIQDYKQSKTAAEMASPAECLLSHAHPAEVLVQFTLKFFDSVVFSGSGKCFSLPV